MHGVLFVIDFKSRIVIVIVVFVVGIERIVGGKKEIAELEKDGEIKIEIEKLLRLSAGSR